MCEWVSQDLFFTFVNSTSRGNDQKSSNNLSERMWNFKILSCNVYILLNFLPTQFCWQNQHVHTYIFQIMYQLRMCCVWFSGFGQISVSYNKYYGNDNIYNPSVLQWTSIIGCSGCGNENCYITKSGGWTNYKFLDQLHTNSSKYIKSS